MSYNIQAAARAAGMSPSRLRAWEVRHGWPQPRYDEHGYRLFSEQQVCDLRRVLDYIEQGYLISELIVDGLPRWPAVMRLQPFDPDFSHLPEPETEVGKHIRRCVERAIRAQHAGDLRYALHAADIVHPCDRGVAIWLPMADALRQADDQGAAIRRIRQLCEFARWQFQQALPPAPTEVKP